MTYMRGADVYRRTEAESRSPLELVVMLYDGALRFLSEARAGIDRGDRVATSNGLSRAMNVILELQNSLNVQAGGDVARQLDAMYTYITGRLVHATVKKDYDAIDESRKLLETMRDGWVQVATTGTGARQ